jgi:hypothetical protein
MPGTYVEDVNIDKADLILEAYSNSDNRAVKITGQLSLGANATRVLV